MNSIHSIGILLILIYWFIECQASERLQDAELLQQFRKVEDLPADQKMIVKELLDAFLLKNEIRGRFVAA